jgi:hypothetical protein
LSAASTSVAFLGALVDVRVERYRDSIGQPARHARIDDVRARDAPGLRRRDLQGVVGGMDPSSGRHFVQNEPEAVDIRPLVNSAPEQLLRRHVLRRPRVAEPRSSSVGQCF